MFSFQGASSSKSNPQLAFWNILFQNPSVSLFLLSNQNPLSLGFRLVPEPLSRNSMKPQNFFCCFSQSLVWWRVPGSNRWPPACKAGALPAELTPHRGSILKWWAKMDSNHRPHDYQSCALASWAIGPYFVEIKSTTSVLKFNFKTQLCLCFSSPNQTRFAGLCFGSFWFFTSYLGTLSSVPSKLNNATVWTSFYPCTDL